MSDNNQSGFLPSSMGELGDFLSWIQEYLQDKNVRDAILVDIGLDPNEREEENDKENPVADASLNSIQQYRASVKPDETAFNSAKRDLKAFYTAIKDFLKLYKATDRIDKFTYRFFELLATNYIRLKYPGLYYSGQLFGFLVESRVSAPKAEKEDGIVVENIWNFLTDPFHYTDDLLKFIFLNKSGWTLALSGTFTYLQIAEKLPEGSRFLYSWDVLPKKWIPENKEDFQKSFHAERLLKRLREDFKAIFEGKNDEETWKEIEKIEAGQETEPAEAGKKIRALYHDTIEKWKRGDWFDYLSENAFSFDIKFPEEKGSESAKYLGATIFFVPKEEDPTHNDQSEEGFGSHFRLFISLNGEINLKYAINDNWDWIIKTSSGDLLDLFISDSIHFDSFGDLRFETGVQRKIDPKTGASYNLPEASGTRLALGAMQASAFYDKEDYGLEIGLKDNALVISGEKADGFLKEIMPAGDTPLKFSLGVGYSKKKGFYTSYDVGSLNDLLKKDADKKDPEKEKAFFLQARDAGKEKEAKKTEEGTKSPFDAVFPIHKNMGLVNFESVDWDYGPLTNEDTLGARLNVLTTFSTKLGPLYIRVDKIGLQAKVLTPKAGGDLGALDFSFGFAPPRSVGLRIESGLIAGGGFLEFDPDNHRYAGVLALKFWKIELTAIALINTRLPNKQKGFSMLISLSVLFNPAIQIGFSFTLSGVGGLIGIHRTVKVDVLRNRIRNGSIRSIMFPENVIANAPKIISDLRAVFPPQKKHYVFAPFLRIGYGTPAIVEVDLGVLWEHPFKDRIILLGSVGIYLPNKALKKRLVELHVDVFGDFNIAESYIVIEGRLRDSHVVGISLSGGFAFVLDWGRSPQFLLSVGGYHPRYKKPARFPDIPRLSALIKRGKSIRLSCEYYQAITSNSFQIGFSAELVVKKGKARAYGFLGFNALLQFDPFFFETDIAISVGVSYRGRKFFGVDLYFLLSGPKPWRAKGYAKIKILFFSLKVRFDYSWGGKQKAAKTSISASNLLGKLERQMLESGNWAGKLPARAEQAESLRSLEESEKQDRVIMHPSGFLEVRQTLLPLNRSIEKMGNTYIENSPAYQITDYEIGAKSSAQIESGKRKHLLEYFSRGQVEDLKDNEKLSTADFDLMPAGVRLAADEAFDFSTEMTFTENEFEDIILEEAEIIRTSENAANWQEQRSLNLSGRRKNIRSSQADEMFGLVEELPEYDEKGYKIVSRDYIEAPEKLKNRYFWSYSAAKDYLHTHWPEEAWENWQITEEEIKADEEALIDY